MNKKNGESVRNGAEALILGLASAGIEVVFGLPGASTMPLFDALYKWNDRIRYVLTRHEQGATHMADGYARATGRPAAVLVTSGPGATNTVTGIMTAYMDSVPLVVVTGQSPLRMLGKDAFQETDVFNLTMPIVKHSYLVRRADDIPRAVKEAVHIATSGRPGPVLLDVPMDVAMEPCGAALDAEMNLPGYHPEARGYTKETLREMADALAASQRPVLLAGHGAALAGAAAEVRALAEKLDAPVACTLLGKGVFPEGHPLSLGMPGMYGTVAANRALAECDLVMGIGTRFDDRIAGVPEKFCAGAVKIHIDIDPAEFGKTLRADIECYGDARAALRDLLPRVAGGRRAEWRATVARNLKRYPAVCPRQGGLHPARIIGALHRLTEGKALLVTDVGQHQMWAAKFYPCGVPGRFITSGGGGTMGFGLPAAIGAQLGKPGETVALVAGDGGFQMTMAELATAVVQKLPVKIIVMNNHSLGMVRQLQDLFYGEREGGVELEGNPDFAALAEAYGVYAQRLRRPADTEKVLRRALEHPGPALVDAEITRHEEVYPMVPAGRPLEEMLLGNPRRRGRGRPKGTERKPMDAAKRKERT